MSSKITINRKNFIDAISCGGVFANKSNTLPNLENIKIKAFEDKTGISVISYNIECGASVYCACSGQVDLEGSIVVNPGELSRFLGSLTDEYVSMEHKDGILVVYHEHGKMKFPTFSSESFDIEGFGDVNAQFTITGENVYKMFNESSDIMCTDPMRQQMHGMLLAVRDGEFEYCATDAHVLITNTIVAETTIDQEVRVIIPYNTVMACRKLATLSMSFDVSVYKNKIMFKAPGVSFFSTLVEGKFPNVTMAISSLGESCSEIKCDTYGIMPTFKRCSMVKEQCVIEVDENNVVVSADNIERSKSCSEEIGAEHSGAIRIGFNPDYVIKALNRIDTQNVIVMFHGANKGAMFLNENDDKKRILVMPSMLA